MSATDPYGQLRFRLAADATEVVLLRHGATTAAVPGEPFALCADGHGDPPLSPLGVRQAAAASTRLARDPPALLSTTTLVRTGQTAVPLAAATGLTPLVVPELREVHLGDWEGGEWRIRKVNRDPIALRVLAEQRWDIIPGGEDAEAFAERVRSGLRTVVAATGLGRRAVAVVHGGVIGELCRQATGSRPFAFVHAENCSLTRLIVWQDGRVALQGFNDTAHL